MSDRRTEGRLVLCITATAASREIKLELGGRTRLRARTEDKRCAGPVKGRSKGRSGRSLPELAMNGWVVGIDLQPNRLV